MATPDGLWAVLTIFEIGRLRDALRHAAFALHLEDVKIDVVLGQERPATTDAYVGSDVVPERVLVVISEHGKLHEPPPGGMRRAS